MTKCNAVQHPFGKDAINFQRPDLAPFTRCIWIGCQVLRLDDDLPLCREHALYIAAEVRERYEASAPAPYESPQRQAFVYYLMLGPWTVKIGTTKDLTARISSMRTDVQYVVAIERGGHDLERQRHAQFAAERMGLRENFKLSPRLKAHIESLMPSRDQLVALATTYKQVPC